MAVISEEGKIEGYLRVAVQSVAASHRGTYQDNKMRYASRKRSTTSKMIFRDESDIQSKDGNDATDDYYIDDDDEIPMYESEVICPSKATQNEEIDFYLHERPGCISFTSEQLQVGDIFEFRVTILDAIGISSEYADIFCQFNFLNRKDEPFSTEPINNTRQGAPLAFYHVQNFSIRVTKPFLRYLATQPILFEIFGHFTQHPLHNESRNLESLLKRSIPPSVTLSSLSKPVPVTNSSAKQYGCDYSESYEDSDANYSLLAWFEVCEMEPCGEYTPCIVEHSSKVMNNSVYLLHQGIQRRIAVTITHETAPEFSWNDVQEIVIGRIRYEKNANESLFHDDTMLSLSSLPTQIIKTTISDRTLYRFEAAWDSSLHNSPLLNCVTPSNRKVYVTLTVYIGLENCERLVVIEKDLCLKICSREAKLKSPRTLRTLFARCYTTVESNCVSGVYHLCLKFYNSGSGSPGMQRRQRRVVDTSATYVRGEENLSGWRPRGDSLILDHQAQLEKFAKILQVEKARHIMQVKEVLEIRKKFSESSDENYSQDKDFISEFEEEETPECDQVQHDESNKQNKEWSLAGKCLKLMQYRIPSIFDFQDLEGSFHDSAFPEHSDVTTSPSNNNNAHRTNSSFEICSFSSFSTSSDSDDESQWRALKYVATVSEVNVSPVISRQGYLNMLDSDSNRWIKWWVVVRRPYVFFYNSHRDPVIRALVNLGAVTVEFSLQQDVMLKVQHTFAVCTKNRGFLLQAENECDLHNWLYAFNPLMAGLIRSKLARRSKCVKT